MGRFFGADHDIFAIRSSQFGSHSAIEYLGRLELPILKDDVCSSIMLCILR